MGINITVKDAEQLGHQEGGGKQGPVPGHELEQNPGKPRTAHSRTRFGLREPGRSRWSRGSADRARGFPSGARLLSPGWEAAGPRQRHLQRRLRVRAPGESVWGGRAPLPWSFWGIGGARARQSRVWAPDVTALQVL